MRGPGFSIELAVGWEPLAPSDAFVLGATKGERVMLVTRYPGDVGEVGERACAQRARTVATNMELASVRSGLVAGPGGKVCQLRGVAKGSLYTVTLLAAERGAYAFACTDAADKVDAAEDAECQQMMLSWQLDAATAPAAPTTERRVTAAGVSVVLPAGWEEATKPRDDFLVYAVRGQGSVIVSRARGPQPIGTQAECRQLATRLARNAKSRMVDATSAEVASGRACVAVIQQAERAQAMVYYAAPVGDPYVLVCDAPVGDTTLATDCGVIWRSFAFAARRVRLAGFSVALPGGWAPLQLDRPGLVFTASRGDDPKTMRLFLVTEDSAAPAREAATDPAAACAARAAQLGERYGDRQARGRVTELAIGTACMIGIQRPGKATVATLFRTASGAALEATCDMRAEDKGALADCERIVDSLRLER